MAEISAQMVASLRAKTGAGMMECKKALTEANGNAEEAEVILRKKGIAAAEKKASRAARQGIVSTYIHPGSQLGVLVEVNCETDFVARTDGFQELVRDIAMQIAAADPKYLKREEVPTAITDKEKEIARDRAINEKKPEKAIEKIVEGRLNKFFEEMCLLEQPFVKDNSMTIEQLIKAQIAALQENITVARFARFKVGETAAPAEAAAE